MIKIKTISTFIRYVCAACKGITHVHAPGPDIEICSPNAYALTAKSTCPCGREIDVGFSCAFVHDEVIDG